VEDYYAGDVTAKTTPERAVNMFIMLVSSSHYAAVHAAQIIQSDSSSVMSLGPWLQIGVLFFGFVINSLGRLLEVTSCLVEVKHGGVQS
jgi:hypothetical protein